MCYVPLYVEYSKSHFKTLLLRCDVVSHGLLVMIMKVLKRTKLEQYWGVLKFWNTTTNIHVKQSWLLNIQMKTKYSGIDLFKLKYTKKQGIGSPHQVSSLVRGVLTTWQSEMNVVCMDIANRSTKAPVGCLSFGNKSAPAQHFVNPFLIPPLDSCSCRTLWKGVHCAWHSWVPIQDFGHGWYATLLWAYLQVLHESGNWQFCELFTFANSIGKWQGTLSKNTLWKNGNWNLKAFRKYTISCVPGIFY